MIKKLKLPTILGIIILLAGTFAGVFFLNMRQVFRIGASSEGTPKDVRISNISGDSATVTFMTDKETLAFIKWGDSESSLKNIANEDESEQKYFAHSINLTGLTPKTTYFFTINSDGVNYDNNGVLWQLVTGSAISLNTTSIPLSGSVITASGNEVKRGLVYLNVSGYMMSTITSDTGNFVFQLGSARSTNLREYLQIDPASTLLEISIQTEQGGFSSAQIFPQSANPIPPMIIGESQDFRNLPPSNSDQNPSAQLSLPEGSNVDTSKFNIPTNIATSAPTSVILESIDDGEVISTTKPEFFGKAPQGTNLTISVHSNEEVAGNVTVPKNGSWSWSPPAGLSSGSHVITISWVDTSGITRSLTRKFIVQAAEVPAFSASNSGTTTTPTPTAISATLKPTPTSKSTATPISEPTESPVPVPVTGDLTPTLFLTIMGIGILVFSFGVWKIAEERI